MKVYLSKYANEIQDFVNNDTLEKIDYGVLDLNDIKNLELKEVLYFIERLLSLELKINYMENNTGIFRVKFQEETWYYEGYDYIIEADSLIGLKEKVISNNDLWYVFDEYLAQGL